MGLRWDDVRDERFPSVHELIAERHGAPVLVTQVTCKNCGALLLKNMAGFWVHLEAGRCNRAVVDVAEVAE